MEQQGLTRKDLEPYLGSQARVSEVLSGKRALSKEMIRRLYVGLGIPAEVLVQERSRVDAETGLRAPSDCPHRVVPARGYSQTEGTVHQAGTVGEKPPESE